jgi:hypothetical protein
MKSLGDGKIPYHCNGLCKDTVRIGVLHVHCTVYNNGNNKCMYIGHTFIISTDENLQTTAIVIAPATICLVVVFGSHISLIHMLFCTYNVVILSLLHTLQNEEHGSVIIEFTFVTY